MRVQILRLISDQEPTSPRKLADALEEPLSNVSYHVRVLADCAALSLVDTTPIRGSTEHFYRGTAAGLGALKIVETGDPKGNPAGESPDE